MRAERTGEEKGTARAAGNACLLLSIFFSLYISLSLCISAATQPAGNEILFREKLADRSMYFVSDRCDWSDFSAQLNTN